MEEIGKKEALKKKMKLINFWCNDRIKKIAENEAIRNGLSLSGYLRQLIIKDNEQSS